MKKMRNNKGFTMAELLIVVAIIAVLVAVAIPVFGNQLEKAREAADESNIRALYAELSAAVLTEDTSFDTTKSENPTKLSVPDAKAKVSQASTANAPVIGIATYKLTQQAKGLASGGDVTIAGVEVGSAEFEQPYIVIVIKSDGSAPVIKGVQSDALAEPTAGA